jgi:hypothetical protein
MTISMLRFNTTNSIGDGLTSTDCERGFLDVATLSEAWAWPMSQRAHLLEARLE